MLRATLVGDEDPATYVFDRRASPTANDDGDVSYRPSFTPPRAGRWLVAVTAGPQWGCFVVDVARPPEPYRTPTTLAEVERMGAEHPSEPTPTDLSPSFARERGPGA